MRAPELIAEALVVKTVPYGESDLVVHLFARGAGKLAAFARGARKSSKRFPGGLEPFAVVEVELAPRASGLADLKRASLVETHPALREDLGRLAHAGYATELVRELVKDGEPNDALFDLAVELYRLVASRPASSLLLRAFELEALGAAGLAPALDGCVRCGKSIDDGGAFDAHQGGLACPGCAGAGALPIDRAGLRLLRALQTGGLTAGLAEDALLPLEPVRAALAAFIARHVRHDLKSLAFLREVGAPP